MSVFKLLPRAIVLAAFSLGLGAQVQAATLTEGFESVAALSGWTIKNNSSPVGTTSWFQGDSSILPAYAGTPNSFIAANFNNVLPVGTISDWLITPTLSFNNGDVISFYTRTDDATFADRLELRFSSVGGADVGTTATSVGAFNLLLSINANLDSGGYPESWTQYTAVISGLSGPTNGAVAFRYFVTDGGVFGDNSNYVAIDSVSIGPAAAAPEPSTWLMMILGIGVAGLQLRRRTRSRQGWRALQDSNLQPLA